MAAQEDHVEVVQLLLEHAADQHIATPVSSVVDSLVVCVYVSVRSVCVCVCAHQ